MKTYRYATNNPGVVEVIDDDGVSRMSMLATEVPEGASIADALPPPPPSDEEVQQQSALGNQALKTLALMTQEEIDAHIDTTFPTLNVAQRQVLKILGRASSLSLRSLFGSRLS